MRGRLLVAGVGVFASLSSVFAQFPPPAPLPTSNPLPPAREPAPYQPLTPPIQIPRLPEPPQPVQPSAPRTMPAPVMPSAPVYPVRPAGGTLPVQPPGMLPPGVMPAMPLQPLATPRPGALSPTPPTMPNGSGPVDVPVEVELPYPENKIAIDAGLISLKRVRGSWQVWMGLRPLRDLGDDETGAKEVVRIMRELHPTEWVQLGSPRPVVEYGLTNGRPPITAGLPPMVTPIDFKTVRVEAVRGVWCLRDDANIHFNFGLNKHDADQALAVVRKYGFNRIGRVGGDIAMPAMTYFFVSLQFDAAPKAPIEAFTAAAQEQALTRTGIAIPGAGYVGISMKIDPQKVEARREGFEWVVAHGPDIIARFGVAEFTARDAARIIQDGHFDEFCTAAGVNFFLVNGQAPTRVPFSVQGRRFDTGSLKVHQLGNRWAVTESGRHLFDVPNEKEGEALVRLLKHFQFDQICQVGSSPRASMKFLAKSRGW